MKRTVVIHQPDFAPYLGFFHRFLQADLYVVLDHVQFVTNTSRSWTHRDKIKTSSGEKWLTLSVKKSALGTPINEIELSTAVDWRTNNLRLLESNYKKAPFFKEIFPEIEHLYQSQETLLAEFNMIFIEWLMEAFDARLPYVKSSSLDPVGQSNELLVDILAKVEATSYLSGLGAKDYFDPQPFDAANIEVVWQKFNHPVYPQPNGDFLPYLSSMDMLFNCGIKRSRELLRNS